jgi:hypothetical protein
MEAGLNLGKFRPFVGAEGIEARYAPFGAIVSIGDDEETKQTRVQLNIYLVFGFLSFGIGMVNSEKE